MLRCEVYAAAIIVNSLKVTPPIQSTRIKPVRLHSPSDRLGTWMRRDEEDCKLSAHPVVFFDNRNEGGVSPDVVPDAAGAVHCTSKITGYTVHNIVGQHCSYVKRQAAFLSLPELTS